jgi:hypothetical protein
MKYIKLFENFGAVNPELEKVLKTIVSSYKEERLGNIVHPSEDFGDGSFLMKLIGTLIKAGNHDNRICGILRDYAMLCGEEAEGDSVHVSEYIDDSDCDYIADFLGCERLNFDEDWTDEEEAIWDPYEPDNSDSVASVVSRIGAHFFGKDGSRGTDGVERQVGAKKFKM